MMLVVMARCSSATVFIGLAVVFFTQDRLNELAAKDPSLRERQPFKAFFERDLATLHALGKQALFEIAFATHAGVTDEAFDAVARQWFAIGQASQVRPPVQAVHLRAAGGTARTTCARTASRPSSSRAAASA